MADLSEVGARAQGESRQIQPEHNKALIKHLSARLTANFALIQSRR